MRAKVNGTEREFADDSTVAEVLAEVGANQRGVAVALDGEVVRRGSWAEVVVSPGAHIEILTAVQGG
ncbi:sulfur carrier protein [Amycolatopsis marina]|uniref:Sulfur carrier protein n=1 Tax=Amycolatopsis marina TaxID=490629 RepID=A0A1I1CD23_9PSEU|nr:sulfur carrier protein ThiS [Amycolatopsis marina]SFB60307.1 sulfur carrier protein [Amycolatopsis marina]